VAQHSVHVIIPMMLHHSLHSSCHEHDGINLKSVVFCYLQSLLYMCYLYDFLLLSGDRKCTFSVFASKPVDQDPF